MSLKSVKVMAPATVSNVACGFDVMGFALHEPGDEMIVRLNNKKCLRLENKTPYDMPLESQANVASVAVQAMLEHLDSEQGFDFIFTHKIRPGSGLGSSAASAVAGVFAANELLGGIFPKDDLLQWAMEGEYLASESYHADNVAPCMLGGFTLIRSNDPLEVAVIPCPDDLYCAVVRPEVDIKTKESRQSLPEMIPLTTAVKQWANVGGLVAGLLVQDYQLIAHSLIDDIVEPVRAQKIPEFYAVKEAMLELGALGCSISGSGPTIFALAQGKTLARKLADKMKAIYTAADINCMTFVSDINYEGVKFLD